MKQIPGVLAAARENLRNPPRVVTETAIQQNRGAIEFYEREVFALAGPTPQLALLKAAAEPVVTALRAPAILGNQSLAPGHGAMANRQREIRAKARPGTRRRADRAQVLADAEAEFTRVRRDMYVIARQLWARYYPRKPLPPDDDDGRRRTVAEVLRAVGREHGRPEDLTPDVARDRRPHPTVHSHQRHPPPAAA